MVFRPAEGAATGCFTLVKHRGDLDKVIPEDFAQQEDRSLERLELLQQNQEGELNRLLRLDTLFRVARFGSLCREDWLR